MVQGDMTMGGQQSYPDALARQEQARLAMRRAAAGLDGTKPVIAMGLSGGGIRSATFALGFFQGLARHGLVRHVDYLSTVSGGGYFGAFLGRLYGREALRSVDDVEALLAGPRLAREGPSAAGIARDPGSTYRDDVLRYLRENGRYLSPNGSGDTLLGGAILLRNLVSLHVTLAFFTLLALLALQLPYILFGLIDGVRTPLLRIHEPVLVSPYVVPALAALALLVIPSGWAYWLVGHARGVTRRELRLQLAGPVLLVLLAGFAIHLFELQGRSPASLLAWTLGLIGIITLVMAGMVDRQMLRRWRLRRPGERNPADEQASRQRQKISQLYLLLLLVFVALLVITLVDSAGASIFWWLFAAEGLDIGLTGLFAGGAGLVGVLAAVQQLVTRFVPRTEKRPPAPKLVIAWAIAIVLLATYLLVMSTVAHGISQGYRMLTPAVAADVGAIALRAGFAVFVLGLVVSLLGQLHGFVNRSGHHALYMARLTRAYLGASNPRRHRGPDRSVLHVVEDDDVALADYHAPLGEAAGAAWRAMPLHLINVTVNETIDGRSQLQQRDRKGIGLAFGPCGMSLGGRHHALFPVAGSEGGADADSCTVLPEDASAYRVFEFRRRGDEPRCAWERLSIGALVSISGAAFSTGLGSRTSLPISVLSALANIRLGYWWYSGIDPALRGDNQPRRSAARRLLERAFPVYSFLMAEMLARFRGTSLAHWYLSDGGHFENLGGYELIRRRPGVMVLVDAEADPDYTYHGLAGLIRKARLDFDADIRFLGVEELAALNVGHLFGSLEQLRRQRNRNETVTASGAADAPARSLRHFALARIAYADENTGTAGGEHWLVYVKPTLTGAEPADLAEYHASNPSFPHQPTSDQFFDENQWESYRMLGEYMADLLSREPVRGDGSWHFASRLRGAQAGHAC